MSDDRENVGPEDGKLISLTESYEVSYWSEVLEVTPDELRAAVEAVGHSAAKVRAYLLAKRSG